MARRIAYSRMAYLRLLTNALLAGTIGAVVCAQLVLFLNPTLPLEPGLLAALGWRVWLTAGLASAAVLYAASLARYLANRRSPGWLSLRLLTWMTTVVVGLGALLMGLNLSAFGVSLPPDTARRMALAAGLLTAGAALLLVIALVHYSFGRRGSRVGGALFAIATMGVVALPVVARGPAQPARAPVTLLAPDLAVRDAPGGRVWLMLLDGASLDYISPAAATGRLPNLGRLLDTGASLTLFSIEPAQPVPVWAAVATGRYPPGNGVPSSATYHLGTRLTLDLLPRYVFAYRLADVGVIGRQPRPPGAIRAPTLWRMLDAAGLPTVIAGWPLARPDAMRHGQIVDAPPPTDEGASARRQDRALRARFDEAVAASTPLVAAIRYGALADVGSEALAEADGDAAVARTLLDRQYDFLDAEVGALLARLADTDMLIVMSGHRLEPASPIARMRRRLLDDAGLAAEASRSDGFILAYGRLIAPGRKPVGAIVDLLPTLLYYVGLPVARDIDGYPRTDLFVPAFTAERPVSYVPSYEREP
ncbi:MAG: alkaline phosphatase family protein [Vicinamibacteria bacterium]